MIPKRIFYCWFGRKELPSSVRKCMATWHQLNPDFEIRRIDENNFDVNYCQFTKAAYNSGNMAFVSDVARIWAIYQYGGVYFDTDVEELKPLQPLLNYRHFWAKEDVGMVASGLGFGAEAGNQILREILQSYREVDFLQKDLTTVSTVKIVSNILKRYGLKDDRHNNKLYTHGMAFAPQYFAPLHYWGGGNVRSETICVHHYSHQSSWTTVPNSSLYYLMHQLMFYCPLVGRLLRWIKYKVH